MARLTPLWQQQGSYPGSVDRRLIGALWPTGGVTGLAVTATGSSMNLNVAMGAAAVPDSAFPGAAYLCASDAVETVTLAAASGQDRIDVVTVLPRDAAVSGTNNDWILNVLQGTPGASPVAPAVPAGQLALAQVRVAQGSATVTAANITDLRGGGLTVAGGPPSTPLAAGAAFQSFTDSTGTVWIAKGGVNGGAWRKASDVLRVRAYVSIGFTVPAGPLGITFNAVTAGDDPYGMAAPPQFNCLVPGVFLVTTKVEFTPQAGATWTGLYVLRNGVNVGLAPIVHAGGAFAVGPYAATLIRATSASDYISVQINGSATGAGVVGTDRTFCAIQYLGTG